MRTSEHLTSPDRNRQVGGRAQVKKAHPNQYWLDSLAVLFALAVALSAAIAFMQAAHADTVVQTTASDIAD